MTAWATRSTLRLSGLEAASRPGLELMSWEMTPGSLTPSGTGARVAQATEDVSQMRGPELDVAAAFDIQRGERPNTGTASVVCELQTNVYRQPQRRRGWPYRNGKSMPASR